MYIDLYFFCIIKNVENTLSKHNVVNFLLCKIHFSKTIYFKIVREMVFV